MVRVPLRCDVTHHKWSQVSFVFNGYICFFPTGKGHCFPSLTLSYRPVLPLSLKNSGSKFFNQKKCILMRYLSKLDILIEFFIYGGPLVPLLHTIKQTLSWIKTCFLCKIVLIFHTTVSQEPITWSLQLPCIFVTAFSQTSLFLVWIYRELGLPTRAHRPIKISAWLISNFTR